MQNDIAAFRKSFDPELKKYLDARIKRVNAIIKDRSIASIIEQASNVASSGGKRARPFMVTALYTAFGGKDLQMIRDVALGVEIFHLFCLVHDDIIDKADQRHGVPAVHALARGRYEKERRRGDLSHSANGQAILVGDFLFAWAYERVVTAEVDNAKRTQLFELFSRMTDEVISGQMIDVDLMTQAEASTRLIKRKMELKTATYSFVRPLQMGAMLGGGEKFEDVLEQFGREIGFAFQLQDDLFDLTASEKETGKPAMNDVREGQHTLLTDYLFVHGTRTDKKTFDRYFGDTHLSLSAEKEILAMMMRVGALDFAQKKMKTSFTRAEKIVQTSGLPRDAKRMLLKLTNYIQARTA